MQPRMWEDFRSSLRNISVHDLESLPARDPKYSHAIRSLHLGGRYVELGYRLKFLQLLSMIPQGRLVTFHSDKKTPLNKTQLIYLLTRQPNLRSFKARLEFRRITIEEEAEEVAGEIQSNMPALNALKFLGIYVMTRHDKVEEELVQICNRILLSSACMLENLEICGRARVWSDWPPEVLFSHPVSPTPKFKLLRSLTLYDLDFVGFDSDDLHTLDFTILHSLHFKYCVRMHPSLMSLAAIFRRTQPQLKVLTVRTRNPRKGNGRFANRLMKALDELLCSFLGLKELEVSIGGYKDIDWDKCLESHRSSLRSLFISSYKMTTRMRIWGWPEKLSAILAQCPNLEQLAYTAFSLCLPLGYVNIMDFEFPANLHREFCPMLESISVAPNIRIIRMLWAPGFPSAQQSTDFQPTIEVQTARQDPAWVERAARVAQHFATLVLRFLEARGSNVEILALSPITRWEQHLCDSGGHYYPHYYYRRKIVEKPGGKILEAIPYPDCTVNIPDRSFFG